MCRLPFALIVLAVGMTTGRVFDLAYVLPDGAQTLLSSPLQTTFSCDQRPYGYYADVANNCQIFQVCLPLETHDGDVVETAQFTFLCSNQTVFSQQNLTCMEPYDALPCNEAEQFYAVSNAQFGVVDDIKKSIKENIEAQNS